MNSTQAQDETKGHIVAMGGGLGFIGGSACPHYDGEKERPDAYRKTIREGMAPGYAADDGVALHFIGTEFVAAVSSRSNASAYRVACVEGDVQETRLQTRYLGR